MLHLLLFILAMGLLLAIGKYLWSSEDEEDSGDWLADLYKDEVE